MPAASNPSSRLAPSRDNVLPSTGTLTTGSTPSTSVSST